MLVESSHTSTSQPTRGSPHPCGCALSSSCPSLSGVASDPTLALVCLQPFLRVTDQVRLLALKYQMEPVDVNKYPEKIHPSRHGSAPRPEAECPPQSNPCLQEQVRAVKQQHLYRTLSIGGLGAIEARRSHKTWRPTAMTRPRTYPRDNISFALVRIEGMLRFAVVRRVSSAAPCYPVFASRREG